MPLRFEDNQQPQVILVPKDAPLLFWLQLPNQYTLEESKAAGLAGMVKEATRARDAMIEKATKHLAPLGIDNVALLEIVGRSIRAST